MLDNGVPDLCTRLLRLCAELRTIGSPISRIGTSVGDGSGSVAERRDVHQRGDAQRAGYARLLMRRCHRSSASVQPFCLTMSQHRVGPASYRLVSSLATRPS
jgi:hypothetical protein